MNAQTRKYLDNLRHGRALFPMGGSWTPEALHALAHAVDRRYSELDVQPSRGPFDDRAVDELRLSADT
jgi:hypothetical protein